MDRVAKLVTVVLALAASAVHAGYAYPADPPGFTRSGGSGFSGYGYATRSANDFTFGRVIYQPNGLTVQVPGKPVTMPVSYRLAQNAPRIAAGVIFNNPILRTALGIAAWLGAAKFIWDEVDKVWRQISDQEMGGTEYQAANPVSPWMKTREDVCRWVAAQKGAPGSITRLKDGACYVVYVDQQGVEWPQWSTAINIRTGDSGCPAGWTSTPAGCLSPAVPQPEFVDSLDGKPMPETVPGELPYPTPLPIDNPPSPWINPSPGPNPNHRPLFVPQGDPLPNPDYNPNAEPSPENQPYIRPGIHINPSPTRDDPFRLDLKPVNRPSPNDNPDPDPESDPDPGGGDKPKPEEQQSLCEKHPDILACAKLDKPDEPDLPEKEKPISITPDGGWGPDGGTCPPPRMLMVQGRQIPIPFDLFCTYMNGIRPVIIAMAWLSAAFILLGAREGN